MAALCGSAFMLGWQLYERDWGWAGAWFALVAANVAALTRITRLNQDWRDRQVTLDRAVARRSASVLAHLDQGTWHRPSSVVRPRDN